MPLPKTVQASVDPAVIGKVGRLFNGTIDDVLAELFQNARRAGASRIGVSALDLGGRHRLAVVDNGGGIDDPAALLTLGHSGWDMATGRREDPAGMGFFSLAGRLVEVRSRSRTIGLGWRMVIEADAWDTARAIAVEPFGIAGGTEVLIDLPPGWEQQLARAVAKAALFLPLTVLLQGAECPRADWLAEAVLIENWQGSRIGVFRGVAPSSYEPTLNFHGVTVPCELPTVAEVGSRRGWHARIDIGDTPRLQLVLPARKEVVRTAFLDEVRTACEAAIFRAVAAAGPHRIGYAQYLRSHALGVPLEEAEPRLSGWRAATADGVEERGPLIGGAMLRMPELEPALAQTAARGLALLGEAPPLAAEEHGFEGYGLYDALDRVDEVKLRFMRDGIEQATSCDDHAAIVSGAADSISVDLTIVGPDDACRVQTFPSDVALIANEDCWRDLDSLAIVVEPGATITVPELVDLLMRAAFSPSDDRDSDSYDTQREWFEQAALQLARTHLIGADAAITGSARDRTRAHICSLVPDGRMLLITATRDTAEAVLSDRPPAMLDDLAFVGSIEVLARVEDTAAAGALVAIREACADRRRALLGRAAATSA